MTVRCCVANVSNVTSVFFTYVARKIQRNAFSFFLLYIDKGLQSIFVVLNR